MTAATQAASTVDATAETLGRLTELGMSELWHVALLLPESFADYAHVQDDGDGFDVDRVVLVEGQVQSSPSTTFGRGAPRTSVRIKLADHTGIRLTWFGDTRAIQPLLSPGRLVIVQGMLKTFDGAWEMTDPTIVDPRWKGRCRPNYGGIGRRMNGDTLRERIVSNLRNALEPAAAFCAAQLADLATNAEVLATIGAPVGVEGFGRLIARAHCPPDPQSGRDAIEAMERFAALVMLRRLFESHERTAVPRPPLALDPAPRMEAWPFAPSPSQRQAIAKLAAIFSAPQVMATLLSGDTGTGKTMTYATIAAAVVDQGGRVAVLLPGESLARQIAAKIQSAFPDIRLSLVTSETAVSGDAAQMVVGTTAMLSRPVGQFDLVICDEQQKLGAKQRQALRGEHAHLLEVTATAIPRTQALAQFGLIETAHLREGHSEKAIATTLWDRDKMRDLFVGVRETIAAGGRVLVVYPAIAQRAGPKGLRSIEAALSKWEAAFPNLVRVLTSEVKGDQRAAHLADLVSGAARIGVCTSVIEVGIDLPEMRRVVVVHPERFGLTTLHQFRGRLAREGGTGAFDMLLMGEVSSDTRERLQIMVDVADGYDLAEADLRLRGPGELAAKGSKQSGGALSILYGRPLEPDHLAAMEPTLRRWLARRDQTHTEGSETLG